MKVTLQTHTNKHDMDQRRSPIGESFAQILSEEIADADRKQREWNEVRRKRMGPWMDTDMGTIRIRL